LSELTIAFVRSLVSRFPSLSGVLEEHVKDNDEILPHVFFGDLTRFTLSLLSTAIGGGGLPPRRELRGILDYLEETYSKGDAELQELIAASFLENLPGPREDGSQIRGMLGPNLRKQLQVIDR